MFFCWHSRWTLCHDLRQVNGLLFEHRNPKALEEQMRRCVLDPTWAHSLTQRGYLHLGSNVMQLEIIGNPWSHELSWLKSLRKRIAKQKIFDFCLCLILLSADKVVKRRSDSFNQRPRGRNRAALHGSDWPSQDFKCQAADSVAMACHFWHESRWLQLALWHVRGF